MPAEFIGDWVPVKGTCDSTVRFRAEGNRFALINGKDSESYGNLFMSATYFGPDDSGISKVVIPDSDTNDPPFMVFFNADEKKGVTKLDIYTEGPVSPHAALAAQQMAHKKLAQRFPPLNNNPLKKCAGGSARRLPLAVLLRANRLVARPSEDRIVVAASLTGSSSDAMRKG